MKVAPHSCCETDSCWCPWWLPAQHAAALASAAAPAAATEESDKVAVMTVAVAVAAAASDNIVATVVVAADDVVVADVVAAAAEADVAVAARLPPFHATDSVDGRSAATLHRQRQGERETHNFINMD